MSDLQDTNIVGSAWSPEDTILYTSLWELGILISCVVTYGNVLRHVPENTSDQELPYRRRLFFYLFNSAAGYALEVVMAVFSILSCIVFVWESYLPESPLWMFWAELLFSTYFAFEYVLRYYVAEKKLGYMLQLQPLVDVVTVTPVFILFFSATYTLRGGSIGFLRFSRIMKFARVLRLLRILRSVTVVSSITNDAIQNQIVTFVSLILSLMVCTTGFVQFLAAETSETDWGSGDNGDMAFHDALYFTIVTFALVGYGDVAPVHTASRLTILCIIVAAFLAIPVQMNKLVRLYRMRSSYSGVMVTTSKESHVIVACDPTCGGVAGFLAEFFHEDHGSQNSKVCVLAPGEPSISMQELILKFRRVTFLKGDLMNADDCSRARADIADAVFLLADRFSRQPDEQDSVTVLRALTCRTFNAAIQVYAEILGRGVKTHIIEAGVPAENILCVNEVKLRLVGTNVLCRGVTALITNLVTSANTKTTRVMEKWEEEYAYGLGQEIYCSEIPSRYVGHAFPDVVHSVFSKFGLLLFAMRIVKRGVASVCINPGKRYSVRAGDMGFFIADDSKQVDAMQLDKVLERGQSESGILTHLRSFRTSEDQGGGSRTTPYTMKNGRVKLPPGGSRTKIKRAASRGAVLSKEHISAGGSDSDDNNDGQASKSWLVMTRVLGSVKANRRHVAPLPGSDGRELLRAMSDASHLLARKLHKRVTAKQPGVITGWTPGRNLDDLEGLLYEGLDDTNPLRRARRERLLAAMQSFIDKGLISGATPMDLGREVEKVLATMGRFPLQALITRPRLNRDIRALPSQFELLYGRKSFAQCLRATVEGYIFGHVLVVASNMADLQFLLEPLRAPTRRHRPIVIVAPRKPDDRVWQPIAGCHDVHFVQGSQLHKADLKRGGIDNAHCAILLSDFTKQGGSSGFSAGDAEVVLTDRIVRAEAPHVRTIAELNNTGFVKHLEESLSRFDRTYGRKWDEGYEYEVPFVTGGVINSSFLEALMCQSFFNPYIIPVVDAILAADHTGRRGSELFATPSVVGRGASMKKLGREVHNRGRPAEGQGLLKLLGIPRGFAGKRYSALFTHLVYECDATPLGLLRSKETHSAPADYVLTNPDATTVVHQSDRIYLFVRGDSAHLDDFEWPWDERRRGARSRRGTDERRPGRVGPRSGHSSLAEEESAGAGESPADGDADSDAGGGDHSSPGAVSSGDKDSP